MTDNTANIDGAVAVLTVIALLAGKKRKSHPFSRMHAIFKLGITRMF